ncbi:MAG: Rne/Rng family ribonuclease [Planctomycetes bacterium]|nr:Rne/Rng family ribonuclease [Planctomycetota bacterium]
MWRVVIMVTHPHRADPKAHITPTAMLAATPRQDSFMADSHDDTTAESRKLSAEQPTAGQTEPDQTPASTTSHHEEDASHEPSHGAEQAMAEMTDAGDDEPIEPDPAAIDRVVDRLDAQHSTDDLRTPSAGEDGDAELLPIEPVMAPTNLMDDEAVATHDETDDESHDGHDEAAEKSMAAVSDAADRTDRSTHRHGRSKPAAKPQVMIVNDTPDECRIGILEENVLQAYFAERTATATNVGNIYKGRVLNIEPAIQAAFVDFGEGASGFLHISDLHPKYFPGKERTERVGKKIPRRERPLIQDALKKGQEITVQVIKEGIGSKGPTLTSYISIPGRLLVMMPDMGRVGVSRKVEDEDERRSMRRMLDSLDLPEGFGFIMRTAGYERSHSELKRDAAYLTRLWEAMQSRTAKTSGPCALYTEGDLLIRTIRDSGDPCMKGIVVDSVSAFDRATQYLDVVAPAHAPAVYYYDRPIPIFSAFGIEEQVELIHQREVPLPSGGALVIDQTEAMVAIDVNSGRSRSARDSETNAYQTNIEAVREICRQLRLRDLGGLIVNDLIDMRMSKHRKDIEARIEEELKRDRAKATHLSISEFGMVEMTRQRMRPSMRKTHYIDCPHCAGTGEVRMPDVVAADALRRISLLFAYLAVKRVHLTVTSRVAGELLSVRRRALLELEEKFGKQVEVTIDDHLRADQFKAAAFDERNHAIELDRLPRPPRPLLADLYTEIPEYVDDEDTDERVKRRRRRRRKPAPADANAILLAGGFDDLPAVIEDERPLMHVIREAEDDKRAARKTAKAESRDDDRDEDDGDDDERSERGERGSHDDRGRRGGRKRRRRRNAPALPQPVSVAEAAALCGVEPAAMLEQLRAAHAEVAPMVTDGLEMLTPELVAVARHVFNVPILGAPAPAAGGQASDEGAESEGAGNGESSEGSANARPERTDGDDREGRRRKKHRRRGGRNRRDRDGAERGSRERDAGEAEGSADGESTEAGKASHDDRTERAAASEDGAVTDAGTGDTDGRGAAGQGDGEGGEGGQRDGEHEDGKRRKRRRRGGRGRRDRDERGPRGARRTDGGDHGGSTGSADGGDSSGGAAAATSPSSPAPAESASPAPAADAAAPAQPKRRSLYGATTRRLKPSEAPKGRAE